MLSQADLAITRLEKIFMEDMLIDVGRVLPITKRKCVKMREIVIEW